MLVSLRETADDRQLRLWCCACVRRIWDQLVDVGRDSVTIAEKFIDGRASHEDLDRARQNAKAAISKVSNVNAKNALRAAAWCARRNIDALGVARSVGWAATYAAAGYAPDGPQAAERSAQADLLRNVFGDSVT